MLLVAGRLVAPRLLEELQQIAEQSSRRQLACHLCQGMNWLGLNGKPALMSARVAINQLARKGHLRLPPPRPGPQRSSIKAGADSRPAALRLDPVECSLAELGELPIVLVD